MVIPLGFVCMLAENHAELLISSLPAPGEYRAEGTSIPAFRKRHKAGVCAHSSSSSGA